MRADPAPGLPEWEQPDLDALLELAHSFGRVGAAALPRSPILLREVVAGLFGVRADGEGGRLELAPWLPEGWRSMALRRLRSHRTVLGVEVRPRAEWATVRLELSVGPAVPVALSLRNVGPVARVTLDEVVLDGPRAVFTLQAQHEAVFFFGGALQ